MQPLLRQTHAKAAVIFRTAGTGGTIAERMRVTAAVKDGIGTSTPQFLLDVDGVVNTSKHFSIDGNRVFPAKATGSSSIEEDTFVSAIMRMLINT